MNLEQRMARLERSNRTYRNLFILAGLCIAALLSYGAAKPVPDVIQARKFEVVNNLGRKVVAIGSRILYGGTLTMHTQSGEEIIFAGVGPSGAGLLRINNIDGNTIFTVTGIGGGNLSLKNKEGNAIFDVAEIFGGGHLTVSNKEGKHIIIADSNGMLRVQNSGGKEIFYAGVDEDANGMLSVNNSDGSGLIHLGRMKHGNGGQVAIKNKTGETVVRLEVDRHGNGAAGAYNRKGEGSLLRPGP